MSPKIPAEMRIPLLIIEVLLALMADRHLAGGRYLAMLGTAIDGLADFLDRPQNPHSPEDKKRP